MSIISSEIEAQKQRDPSYIDSDLQWAWGRGYKAGASREITEEEIAAAIYDYDHAPAKILYPIDVIIDQLYDHYGTETEVEE